MSQVTIVGRSPFGKIAESEGIFYLLTPCCEASGKGSMVDEVPAIVCRKCYNEVDAIYGMAGDSLDQIINMAGGVPALDVKETAVNEKTDTSTTAVVDAHKIRETAIELRKGINMSRRQLAEILGWKEARVWYLEQESTDVANTHNWNDLSAMFGKLEELKDAGWTRPSVKGGGGAAQDVKAIVDDAVAEAVSAARQAFVEELDSVAAIVQAKIDEAKAKKAGTKAFVEILEALNVVRDAEAVDADDDEPEAVEA